MSEQWDAQKVDAFCDDPLAAIQRLGGLRMTSPDSKRGYTSPTKFIGPKPPKRRQKEIDAMLGDAIESMQAKIEARLKQRRTPNDDARA